MLQPSVKLGNLNFRLGVALIVFGLFAGCGARAQQFAFRHYGQDDGLRNLDVFQLMQDRDGLLWSATENGLFRYDGSEFHRFGTTDGIEENMVLAVHQDASGRIWIVTSDHLYYLTDGRFVAVPNGSAPLSVNAGRHLSSFDPRHIVFLNRSTLMLAQPSGTDERWAISPYFSAAQMAAVPELSHVRSMLVGRDGVLWAGCGEALCRVQGDRIEVMESGQGVPKGAWTALFEDRQGGLWIRNAQHIRVLVRGATSFADRDITPAKISTFVGAGILAFAEDRAGNILTQSANGVARWDGTGWQCFDASNGLNFTDISTILSDQQGSLWFSTRGHGLHRWLGYGKVQNWTTAQGLRDGIVWTIFRDHQAHVWLGDELQVSQLEERERRIRAVPGLPAREFQQPDGFAQSAQGTFWIVNLAGRVLRRAPHAEQFTEVSSLPAIVRLVTDSFGRIWFCTREGLYVLRDPDGQTPEKINNAAIAADSFTDVDQGSDGTLWFVADHHLYRLSGERWTQIAIDQPLTAGQFRSIAAAKDGSLWVGGGMPHLLHLRVEGDQARLLAALAPPEIVSTDIQFAHFDRRGWLWVGTDLGVNVFDGRVWRLITRRDGLISNDTNEGAFFADNDGSIWIGVNGGAIHLLHPEELFPQNPLEITLQSVTLGDMPFKLLGKNSSRPWKETPADIKFTSPNYDRGDSLLFRYRLVGLEPMWNKTTAQSLHYPAMQPGDYTFEVQALDPDQQTQSRIVSFSFSIRPPWWRTNFFYFFLCLLTFSLSLLVWYWRERRLIRNQQILRKLVALRTRELEAEKAELVAAREALHLQATHDSLTGLWNRSAILEVLGREIDRARREHLKLAVVVADIDHFKKINDTLGHLAGDEILRDAAHRMLENIRPTDSIGRYGGEEFLIVLPGLPTSQPSARLTQLQRAISGSPFVYRDESIFVTSSFGVAWLDLNLSTIEDMVRCADEALYRAKASGRDCIIFYTQSQTMSSMSTKKA